MKKLFFFFLFFPILVQAGSIRELEVENGALSRVFETDNNWYSILLNEGEETPEFTYLLSEDDAVVNEVVDDEKVLLEVTNQKGEKETYTFYVEKKEASPVFQDYFAQSKQEEKEVPHLKEYVFGSTFVLILILFKFLFLRHKRK